MPVHLRPRLSHPLAELLISPSTINYLIKPFTFRCQSLSTYTPTIRFRLTADHPSWSNIWDSKRKLRFKYNDHWMYALLSANSLANR
ncbi:hypothetical protein PCANC_15042 [Puccinia coronata f. sp. avenae]|uniref:Uncharacterized protein n=1 Tax=Puccinia coronata f. sp. avenae TaxID=200324 RepID=A0A2N5U7X1_9BASI|nr:hypothetical protein PCANC_17710 [Puccinia coronata f. sp. avenae]PLW33845.1 hypothetical protein PCANC_15042 [Puccinia coronata f. sp. avenae]PLW43246.1 hypothetical protein PCASD_07006 [Puccinia coronata f. sp. avenae]